ncbi:MAG TPA: hypothetical protein VN408_26630, partial [Actinoplanes sp.]|nr:hypothetical protein [Actinoplanes sp.]
SLVTVLGVTTWTILTALIGRAAVRSGRGAAAAWLLAGVPLAAVAAAAVATLPVLITQGLDAATASLLLGDLDAIEPDGTGLIVFTGDSIGAFAAYGWLAVLYGRRAAVAPERAVRLPDTGFEDDARPGHAAAGARPGSAVSTRSLFPAVVLGAGLGAVLAGVLAWAYTVTYLTPAMPVMSSQAPMPGGDGEIYLWVAELRWTAILLAALGLVIATANRRSAARAAVVLAVGLLATEAVLLINEVTGPWGMRIALLAAAGLIAASWALAGPVLTDTARPAGASAGSHTGARAMAAVIRVRTTAVAITAGALGPLLFAQSTPVENHEFMPLGLPVTTVALAVGLALLGTVTAAATSLNPLHPVPAALLVVVPAALLAGFGVYFGNGVEGLVSGSPVFLGLPLAVVITAVLRRHRTRRPGWTTAVWTLLALAAAPAGLAVLYAAVMPLSFVPNILFAIDGTSYPADGVSVIPGAALLLLPAAIWTAGRPGGAAPTVTRPVPGPDPLPGLGPDPVPGPDPQPVAGPESEARAAV